MSYYTGQGDYYSGKGDPGFTSILGGILGTAGKILPGPIGGLASAGSALLSGGSSSRRLPTARARATSSRLAVPSTMPRIPAQPNPGLTGVAQRLIPGGSSGYSCGSGCSPGYHLDKTEGVKCVKNRKTNYANPRALARASKRLDGFVGVARKAMKSTNYKVVSKSYKQNWRKPLKK